MKAMILAAGRGERMRPLTDSCPKPLLMVKGKALIVYHIEKLVAVGIKEIVINHAWLGEKIEKMLGDGNQFGASIVYSNESEGALETAGGIAKALTLLGTEPFLVINGDIFIDYDFTDLPDLKSTELAHLWLTKNPEHNLTGDFYLIDGQICNHATDVTAPEGEKFTFSGIALYRPEFFQQIVVGEKLGLAPLIRQAADNKKISGSHLKGQWTDVGTPERLAKLNE